MKRSSLMKRFVFVGFAALAVVNCGGSKESDSKHTPTADSQLYGSWKGLDAPIIEHVTGFKIGQMETVLNITKDSLTARVSCHIEGHDPLHVEATSPIIITPTRIQILKSMEEFKEVDINGDYRNCSVSIDQGYLDYQVSGKTLILQSPSQKESLVLTKI